MRDRILGYFNIRTSKDNCWVAVDDLFREISNNPIESSLFEYTLLILIQERIVRFNESDGIELALEEIVQEILSDVKLSAIDEMREELRICEETQDYEGAIEWRDMINESIDNENN